MSKEIIKASHTEEITDSKRAQIMRDAEAFFADSIATGQRKILTRAAAMHNIKAFQAYRAQGFKSWKEFCEANEIQRENSYHYLDIARGLIGTLEGIDPEKPFLFTKQFLDGIYRDASQYFRTLGVRELHKLANKQDAFEGAYNGKEIQKLLPPPKETTEEDDKKAANAKGELADFNDHMRKLVEPYGWKWNAKLGQCEHEDGTPLTEEERGQITPPNVALMPFRMVETAVNRQSSQLEETILREMKNYVRYNLAIKNYALQKEAYAVRNRLQERFQEIIHMLDAVIEGDEARVKEIHKHGLEEA